MKTLLIYASFFGNTEKIAQAVGEVLNANIVKISDTKIEDLGGFDLIVFGSPTRAFRPSPEVTAFLAKVKDLHGAQITALTRGLIQKISNRRPLACF
jgi:flavodoxin